MSKRILFVFLGVLFCCAAAMVNAKPAKVDHGIAFSLIEANFNLIKDYQAEVTMTIKGPQISINRMPMTIYYKQPDKFKLDAKAGMAFAPQGVFTGNPAARFSAGSKPAYLKNEKIRGIDCWVYTAADAAHPGATAMIWVDSKRIVVIAIELKWQINLKSEWEYIKIGDIYLPSRIKAEIETPVMQGGMHHRFSQSQSKSTAVVVISKYKLNKGLPDSLFIEKVKK